MQIMKLDDGKPYYSTMSHEFVSETAKSDGCLKLDNKTRWEGENKILAEIMVEHTNQSQFSYMKAEHRGIDKARQVVIEDVSYDKDIVEIKLPDTVVSSDCGVHFVKDVCIDDGVLQQRISAQKIDEKASLDFDRATRDINIDLREETGDDCTKSSHELKPETVLPVGCAGDVDTEEQYSSGKEYDVQYSSGKEYDRPNRNKASDSIGEPKDGKLSLQQLFSLESAMDSQNTHTVSSESSENHKQSLEGEEIAQVSAHDCHEVEALGSKPSELVHSGLSSELITNSLSADMPEEDAVATASDVRGPSQVNHYNPFVDYGSWENSWKPEYPLPAVIDAASTEPIYPVEQMNSFGDLVNGASDGLSAVESASPGGSDIQATENSNDHSGSPGNVATSDAFDETAVCTSLSPNNVKPSDVNGENHPKCEVEGNADVHDSKLTGAENGTNRSKDRIESNSATIVQKDSVIEQTVPDSAKMTTRIDNRNPFESNFSGPSILSGPVSDSGHIAYSGNISHRSDSSTTSARSFAFPVLQKEWNSSPVRMVKADRRHFRRHRGWKNGFLCCKF